jgi:hypothetical protein
MDLSLYRPCQTYHMIITPKSDDFLIWHRLT